MKVEALSTDGSAMSKMITGEKPTCGPTIYRFNRFIDGSEYVYRH